MTKGISARPIATAMLLLLAAGTLPGQSSAPPTASHDGPLCFRPRRLPNCGSYIVFELTGTIRLVGTVRPHAGRPVQDTDYDLREYLAFDVGHMVNRDSSHALGWSVQAGGSENGGTRFALKVRRRDWHAAHLTTDLAVGLLAAQQQSLHPNEGVAQGYGLTAEAALGTSGLANVMLDADAITVQGHPAAALHAGLRLESYAAVAGGLVVLVGAVAVLNSLRSGF